MKFYFKKYLNILKNIFSLDTPNAYEISDDDIKEFFKHLRLLGKKDYTMAYFYKWHREYKDKKEL